MPIKKTKKKVLLVTTSLANGGAERSTALLSILLTQLGYEVHITTVLNKIEFEYEGQLLNLGLLKEKNNTVLGRINRFFVFRKYIKKHEFDYIIDNRTRTKTVLEFIISNFVYNLSLPIYMVRSGNIHLYFPKNKFIAKTIYKKAYAIIGVSREIETEIKSVFHYMNVKTIYNPIHEQILMRQSLALDILGNFILAYGRIDDEVKNYTLLINAYAKSNLPKMSIQLFIIGEGQDLEMLKEKVSQLNLSDKILFKGKLVNPFPYVKKAIFTTLTSKYEGFPRVIIESLALETPVVTVNCKSGPAEIVINGVNGLLVENNNPDILAQAMNRMIEDKILYENCKMNAKESIKHLSLDNVSKDWQKIIEG
ncbi:MULTISPECIES: glycosyltransferase [Flavobacterium]|uniref:Glycosyltransferase n=1 Tax=Flavobacterium hankyongi TaxID=1176532 RepID=A0ABP8ZVC7_9FLAO|nr:glycosyltransferase [Flavobacterium sp. N1846]